MFAAIAVLIVGSGLTACSDGEDNEVPSAEDVASAVTEHLPECSDVWVEGETLPDDYEGCINDKGNVEIAGLYICDDDRSRSWTSFQDTYVAILGGDVKTGKNFYDGCRDRAKARQDGSPSTETETPQAQPTETVTVSPNETDSAESTSPYDENGNIWLTTDLEGQNLHEVAIVQSLLNQHGYDVVVDGSYGPQTAGAARAFQNQVGITVDGIVGPETYDALTMAGWD